MPRGVRQSRTTPATAADPATGTGISIGTKKTTQKRGPRSDKGIKRGLNAARQRQPRGAAELTLGQLRQAREFLHEFSSQTMGAMTDTRLTWLEQQIEFCVGALKRLVPEAQIERMTGTHG